MSGTGKGSVRVRFVAKEGRDKLTSRVEPAVVTLQRGESFEFEVFVTPLCSTTIDDKVMLVVKCRGEADAVNIPVPIKAETEISMKLHNEDVVCD